MILVVSARRIEQLLNAIIALFVTVHLAGQYSAHILGHPSLMGIIPRLNMNRDLSVPTFFAAVLLLAYAAMLALIALAAHRLGDRFTPAWVGLSLLFTAFGR